MVTADGGCSLEEVVRMWQRIGRIWAFGLESRPNPSSVVLCVEDSSRGSATADCRGTLFV